MKRPWKIYMSNSKKWSSVCVASYASANAALLGCVKAAERDRQTMLVTYTDIWVTYVDKREVHIAHLAHFVNDGWGNWNLDFFRPETLELGADRQGS